MKGRLSLGKRNYWFLGAYMGTYPHRSIQGKANLAMGLQSIKRG